MDLSIFALSRVVLALTFAQDAVHLGADGHERRPEQEILCYEVTIDLARGHDQPPQVLTTVHYLAAPGLRELVLDYDGPSLDSIAYADTYDEDVTQEWRDGKIHLQCDSASGVGGPEEQYFLASSGWPGRGLFHAKNRHGDEVVFTDAWPSDTRAWMPCEDHPSDKALFDCTLHLPKGWRGIANGRRVGERTEVDGTTTVRWRSDTPIYTALMSFAAGPFTVVASGYDSETTGARLPLEWWLYPQDAAAGTRDFAIHVDALRFLERTVGRYPYAKYAVVQIPTQYGGVENASNTFLRDSAVDGTGGCASTLVHELCHQWFGDSVTEEDWHDLWLSEGFATYFAAVTMDALGREPLAQAMAKMRRSILAAPEVKTRPICGSGFVDPKTRLDANSYPKGAWFLHSLRHELGDDAFFRGIRRYYADHRDGSATRDDLRRAMELETHRDLTAFFQLGLERAGFPIVRGEFALRDGRLVGRWAQHNAAPDATTPWPLRFELALGQKDGDLFAELGRTTIELTSATVESTLSLPDGVDPSALAVRLDPDVTTLAQFEVTGIACVD